MSSQTNSSQSRAIIHILYMDVVSSTLLPMEELRVVYEQLNALVRQTPEYCRAETTGSVLSRPSGDGMALVFFSNMEAPVHCALELAAALKRYPNIHLRMGIHSGEVLRVLDINAHDDVTGEGIILAKRIMDCGDAGHILVSGTVAETLEKTDTWEDFLHFIGVCQTKHGQRLALWNLYNAAVGNPKLPQQMVDQIATDALAASKPAQASITLPVRKSVIALLYALLTGIAAVPICIAFVPEPWKTLIPGFFGLLLVGIVAYLIRERRWKE